MLITEKFSLDDKVSVITGGAGLLGQKHAQAIIEGGGLAVLLDISRAALDEALSRLRGIYGPDAKLEGFVTDITDKAEVEAVCAAILKRCGHIDILINNAANNPKVEGGAKNMGNNRFESFSAEMWREDLSVGLTGAFICAQVFGSQMARQGKGVILNISSDLGLIAPDQRIYKKEGLDEEDQPVKPVTYSVIKHGLIGLTKYLATYWAEKGVRSNALCPAGVYNGQSEEFVSRLTNLIPLGRMAQADEYMATILYLVSDASAYMTGSTVVVDGGRTAW